MTEPYRLVHPSLRCSLGEGPVWLPDHGLLAWVDIVSNAIHSMSLGGDELRSCRFDERIGWVLPCTDGGLIAGFASGLWRIDLEGSKLEFIGDPEPERPFNRLNDAKVDRWGRVWFGSKDDSDEQRSGAFYRLDRDLTWSRQDDGYGVTNGPTFSPDGRLLYHTDSHDRVIYRFDLAEDGTLSDKRQWLEFKEEWGHPDGMTTDADGCLWVAHWGGARISRFSQEGMHMRSIDLPALNVTSCCFAGPDADRLFVTSASVGDPGSAYGGCLFEVDAGVVGLLPVRFG